MSTNFHPIDRQPPATTRQHSQLELSIHAVMPGPRAMRLLPAGAISGSSFSNVLALAVVQAEISQEDIAAAMHICNGYMSRFMHGVSQQWAKRLVMFMRATNNLGPLQWLAEQLGCDLVQRDTRAAEVAELRQRLHELGHAA